MYQLPEPHPLDFDWRFTAATVDKVCELLPCSGRVLCVGTPSIARSLDRVGSSLVLVDRQPFQGVASHMTIEPGYRGFELSNFASAIVDPPWYPDDFLRWVTWAAGAVETDGEVFASIWSDSTRPTAANEYQEILKVVSDWAAVELLPIELEYRRPLFEEIAAVQAGEPVDSTGIRTGRLLRLKVKVRPKFKPTTADRNVWIRIVIDNYQLAICQGIFRDSQPIISRHPGADDWTWRHVSRRSPGRDAIGLWSSRNEVAIIGDSRVLFKKLRAAFFSKDAQDFEKALSEVPDLRSWKIPRPPYWRLFESTHLQ
jgi:hypothetical protein